jgi:hypothetical protein
MVWVSARPELVNCKNYLFLHRNARLLRFREKQIRDVHWMGMDNCNSSL